MAINFTNGGSTNFTRPVRAIRTAGPSGCPSSVPLNSRMAETVFTLANPAAVVVAGFNIRTNSQAGRCDQQLFVNGNQVDQTLDFNDGVAAEWQQSYLGWMGNLSAGENRIWMASNNCTNWGCGSDWGHLQVLIFE